MKRLAVVLVATFTLAGCAMTDTEMREMAERRDACNELGGTFVQWSTDVGERWRCDFDQREDSDG